MLPTLSINTIPSVIKAIGRRYSRLIQVSVFALAALFTAQSSLAAWTLNMREGITEISRQTYHLHMIIIWVCVIIAVLVYGVLFYSLIAYRKSAGAVPAKFHHNTTAEIIWTVIPFLILIGMAIPSTAVLKQIYSPGDADMDIMITGYQWRWQYKYMSNDTKAAPVVYFSNLSTPQEQIENYPTSVRAEKGEHYLLEVDEPLVIPANKKVRFLLTSADVIHAWWMPDFSIKKDAIPGFVNEAWVIAEKPGIYRGQCAELCGRNHGFMPIVVEVKEQADYDAWYVAKQAAAQKVADMTNQQFSMEELMEKGQTVYTTYCQACHQPNGQGLPPTFPALAGSKIATGPIEDHLDRVIKGKTGTAMAAFGAQLSPVDIAAVVTFERNSFGNKTGDMATPLQVFQMTQPK